mmetsp:Transcript_8461/g.20368  ORF Transcript_8461/g.20368 Transcript_8461/m.20368 type:complete len:446 (+) Transcript_8461:146-1483(+)
MVESKPLTRLNSLSDFQDGGPSHQRRSSLQFSFRSTFNNNTANPERLAKENDMNGFRQFVGLYKNFPLADDVLKGASYRQEAFKESGKKQLNHVRGTDGWFRSMLTLEVRAIDNYFPAWLMVTLNALLASFLSEVFEMKMGHAIIKHWDTVYSLVLKTSLAFLLVFRLNRCALRFWEARGYWGAVTHLTRNLVSGILMYCRHSPQHRDQAIRWASAFCVASMHFIRSEHEYNYDELAGFLTESQINRMKDANHAALFAASMCRYHLHKAFRIDAFTAPQKAHAYAIQLNELESRVGRLVEQVSGMEKIRSTPLPVAYVTHLRTFLFTYLCFFPYAWVDDWGWTTVPMVAFTAFALFGIEGCSSEVEIPFNRSRANHLALDAYCMIILESVQGLIVQDANLCTQTELDQSFLEEEIKKTEPPRTSSSDDSSIGMSLTEKDEFTFSA